MEKRQTISRNVRVLTEHAYVCAFVFVCAIDPIPAATKLAAKIMVGFPHQLQMHQQIMDGTSQIASLFKVICMFCYMITTRHFVYIVTPQIAHKHIFFSMSPVHRIGCVFMMTSSNGNIFRVTGHFPHKGQWRVALMFTLISVWINDSVNNREAGDLKRYRPHYDVIVMCVVVVKL